jgi:hypothetical protein
MAKVFKERESRSSDDGGALASKDSPAMTSCVFIKLVPCSISILVILVLKVDEDSSKNAPKILRLLNFKTRCTVVSVGRT